MMKILSLQENLYWPLAFFDEIINLWEAARHNVDYVSKIASYLMYQQTLLNCSDDGMIDSVV